MILVILGVFLLFVPQGVIEGSYRAVRLPSRRISEKSAVFPRRMVQRGGGGNSPLFSENWRQGGLTARELPEKRIKNRGFPFLSDFGPKLVNYLRPFLMARPLPRASRLRRHTAGFAPLD